MTTVQSKVLIDVLNKKTPDRRAVWMMRQAGRYLPEYRETRKQAGSFLDLCYTPALAEEVTLQPLRRFDFDAAIVFADILLVPHAMGQQVGFKEGEGPVLSPIRNQEALSALHGNEEMSRLESVCETIDRLSQSLPKPITLIGFCGAPWTVATYMVEGGTSRDRINTRRAAWEGLDIENHWFNNLMDRVVDLSITYLKMQVAAGAEVLQIFETWASDLPPALFGKFSIDPVKAIVSGVKETYPDIPIIGFPRAAGLQLADFAKETGIDGVGVDSSILIKDAIELAGPNVTLQGNLDPLCLLQGGEVLKRETQKIVESLDSSRHIFNLGHGILPPTPVSHVETMIETVRNHDKGLL